MLSPPVSYFPPFLFFPKPNTLHPFSPLTSILDKWDTVQGAALRQGRLCWSVIWGHWGLPLHSGALPLERSALLQGPEWLLGILRAPQLPRSPVHPGKGWISQACGLGCSLSHRAVLPPHHWVTLIKRGCTDSLWHIIKALWLWFKLRSWMK